VCGAGSDRRRLDRRISSVKVRHGGRDLKRCRNLPPN
jgi:hypothetical protein